MIANLQLDPARAMLITVFSDTYIPLKEEEWSEYERQLERELSPREVKKHMEFMTYYHRKGRAEGRAEGVKEGKVDMIVKAFRKRFGFEQADLSERLLALTLEELDELNVAMFTSNSLDDFLRLLDQENDRN